MKDKDFKRITIAELQSPEKSGLYKLYINYWWATDIDGMALMHEGEVPQCNASKTIAHLVRARPYKQGKPVFLPKAFVPVNAGDLGG